MTLHLESLPTAVEMLLREKAEMAGRTVEDIAIEMLSEKTQELTTVDVQKRELRNARLREIQGSHHFDEGFFKAMEAFDKIDPEGRT